MHNNLSKILSKSDLRNKKMEVPLIFMYIER